VLLASACAGARLPPRTPAPSPPAIDLSIADRLVDQGCYACLQEAHRLYEQAAHAGGQFSTALLLAMREKELGLEATPWIDRATRLASSESRIYLDIVAAVPWTSVATATDFEVPRPQDEVVEQWLEFLTRPGSNSVLDRYTWLAIACSRRTISAAIEDVETTSPLLQYRRGICGPSQRAQLDTVFAASPRFVEVGFFLARYELVNGTAQPRITRALPLLTDVHAAIPTSPVITATLANLWRARTEYARALTLYDQALALRPTQRDALLGRVTTLTYLGRGEEAIAAATAMIELGTWYLGDAFYWRAWNLYQRGQLTAASDDVANARQLQTNGAVLTLSGMIAYDQQRRDEARRDFTAARRMNPATNCPAIWYLGLISLDEQMMRPARDGFADAARCYTEAAASARNELETLPPDLSPEALAQQKADVERRILDNQRQEARSALNTAMLSRQLSDREMAERYARVALGHDLTKERAQAVLAALARP
jgi:tetratricopeptide (TPR) repeat protein